MKGEFRDLVKGILSIAAGLSGIGLFLEGALAPDNGLYFLVFLVSGAVWLKMYVTDKQAERASRVRSHFGVSEASLRSMFGMSEEDVNQLLDDPMARRLFSEHLRIGFQGLIREQGGLSEDVDCCTTAEPTDSM